MSADRLALAAGLGLLAAAVCLPVNGAAEASLTAHMLQHIVLLQVAPLLIVIGWPGQDGSMEPSRRTVVRRPMVAWVAGVAAMTLWYAPPLFRWMMATPVHHHVAQASLVAAGLLFWSPVFSRRAARKLEPGIAIAYLFTACLASTITGAAIAFAPAGVYRGHAVSAFDQQIAGLMMWVPCCTVYVAATLTTLARWYGGVDDERGAMARAEARTYSAADVLPGHAGDRDRADGLGSIGELDAARQRRRPVRARGDLLDQRAAP